MARLPDPPTDAPAPLAAYLRRLIQALGLTLGRLEKTAGIMPTTSIAALPSAALPARWIYVHDATGGGIPCFNDGADWRRADDRTVVS